MKKHPSKKELKSFLLIFAGILLFIALYPIIQSQPIRIWLLPIVSMLLVFGLMKPQYASGVYKVWMSVSEAIGNLISKIIMTILFFGVFTPIAILLKLLNKDLLHKRIERNSTTYWSTRELEPGSMKNQF